MKYRRIHCAYSMNNGIAFYSNCHRGYLSIAILEKNNIKLKWRKERKNKLSVGTVCIALAFTTFCYLILILGIRIAIYESIKLGIRLCLMTYALSLTFMLILVSKLRQKQQNELFRYHSAEHMVINAYRDLKRIPNLEEIQLYSRYTNTCGTNKITRIIFMLLIMLMGTFIPNKVIGEIVILLSHEIARFVVRRGYLNFMQYFTTATPRRKHLILAIEGLRYWLENEQE